MRIRKIGEGGTGAVYMACDTQLDIRVAIKVMSPGLQGLWTTPNWKKC